MTIEAQAIRDRADRCRTYARDYAHDVGASLNDLAVKLDERADRLDAAAAQPGRG